MWVKESPSWQCGDVLRNTVDPQFEPSIRCGADITNKLAWIQDCDYPDNPSGLLAYIVCADCAKKKVSVG